MSTELDKEVVKQQDLISKIQTWFEENQKMVSYIGIGIVAVVGLYFAYTEFYQKPREKEAASALYPIEKAFALDSMDAILKGINGGLGVREIADDFSGTKAGNMANYMAGIALLSKGEYDAAIEHFEDFSASDPFLGPNGVGLIGDCYAAKKDYKAAAKYFDKAGRKNINNLTTTHWLFKAGAAYEKLEQWDDAEDAYNFIKKHCKDAQNASSIDKYISYVQTRKGENIAK